MNRSQRGGASIMVIACLGLLLFLGAALGVVGAMVAAHRRAEAAADLASLAAARVLQSGGDACAEAASLAQADGARLVGCRVTVTDVLVTVAVDGPRWLGRAGDLSAEARAGPASGSAAQ